MEGAAPRQDGRAQEQSTQLGVDRPAHGSFFCEEALQQQHLAEADHEQGDRLANRPVRDAAVQVFGPGPVLGLPEPVMRLGVNHGLQSFVDGHAGGLHLGESCDPVPHVWENRRLVAHLKIKVDGLMREGGKLITEAKLIDALDLSPVRKAVILLLGFPVDGVPQGSST